MGPTAFAAESLVTTGDPVLPTGLAKLRGTQMMVMGWKRDYVDDSLYCFGRVGSGLGFFHTLRNVPQKTSSNRHYRHLFFRDRCFAPTCWQVRLLCWFLKIPLKSEHGHNSLSQRPWQLVLHRSVVQAWSQFFLPEARSLQETSCPFLLKNVPGFFPHSPNDSPNGLYYTSPHSDTTGLP